MEIRAGSAMPVSSDKCGQSLSIALTDPTTNEWFLKVEAEGPNVKAVVGVFRTAPPGTGGPTRWVGFAHVPGIAKWSVTATLATGGPNATADLALEVSDAFNFPGLAANNTFATVLP